MAMVMDGKVHVDLGGPDGNAFVLMGIASDILKQEGRRDEITDIMLRAKESDYDHLLTVLLDEVGDQLVLLNVPEQYFDTVEASGVEIHD